MNILILDYDYGFSNSFSIFLRNCFGVNSVTVFHDFFSISTYILNQSNTFEFIFLDLDVQDLDLQYLITNSPNNTIFIAYTTNHDSLINFANHPRLQKIFIKPFAFTTFFDYFSYHNDDFLNKSRSYILKNLSTIGFNLNHSGTIYLIESIILSAYKKIKKLTEIYAILGCETSKSQQIIGWSINNALNHALKNSPGEMQAFLGVTDLEKITPKYIINHFSNILQSTNL